MSIQEYIASLKQFNELASDIVCHRTIPGRPGRFAGPDQTMEGPLSEILSRVGIKALYAHQHQAIQQIQKGIHTVVATPTASGKSLIYNVPVLETLMASPNARALYLFPLKALARDQFDALETLLRLAEQKMSPGSRLTATVYDGDLSAHAKTKIRKSPPNVLLTNPEMLHLSMLAHHHLWEDFFRDLAVIVVDEVHTYRGVMGSHMAWVFRRLRRICSHYGSSPVFVFCSATINNPGELARELTGLDVCLVDANSAPSGQKEVLLMNGNAGAAQTAIKMMHAAIHRGIRTIVYAQSRKITELIAMWASERAGSMGDRISAYRAGFLPEERREIEAGLASGSLLAVVTTSALELGIDVGNLDLCILVGYPGTIMSTWQRAGRVGRHGDVSAMVFVAHEDALDHYFMNNPDTFFSMPPEDAVINPYNPVILKQQLECAAADISLVDGEPFLDHPAVQTVVAELEASAILLRSGDGNAWHASRTSPHRNVSLRGTGRTVPIFTDGGKRVLGDIDWYRSFYETHEGAVYLHHGETYCVTEFDHETGRVETEKRTVNYFTRARSTKSTEILSIQDTRMIWNTRAGFGRLKVTDHVTGYERKLVAGQRSLGIVPLDLPEVTFETEGFWIEIPDSVRDAIEADQSHFMGGIHALEHAAIGILPLLVMTDRNDLGGISIPFHPQTQKAAVFIYDGVPGGIGLSRQAFAALDELLRKTSQTIASCRCDTGCPVCVHSPKCGSGNRPIDKAAAAKILHLLEYPLSREAFTCLDRYLPVSEPHGDMRLSGQGHQQEAPRRFGVLDIETRRSAQEVGGWHRADRMGVSCAVLYDSETNESAVYYQEDIERLEHHLRQLDLVVGFNSQRFDYKVLSGLSVFDFDSLPTLDLLQRIHRRLGYRISLDNLALATLGTPKSAHGLMALEWWKQGNIDAIVDYCRQDVNVTRDLYLFGRANQYLLFTNKARQTVRVPVDWA